MTGGGLAKVMGEGLYKAMGEVLWKVACEQRAQPTALAWR